MAAAVQLGGKPVRGQIPSGGGNGFGLDVKAQHPARPARQTAQKRRISAVAAGGIHQQLRVLQPGRKEVLHELHRKPNFAQNASSPGTAGSGAVKTVAVSLSYPPKRRNISFSR